MGRGDIVRYQHRPDTVYFGFIKDVNTTGNLFKVSLLLQGARDRDVTFTTLNIIREKLNVLEEYYA